MGGLVLFALLLIRPISCFNVQAAAKLIVTASVYSGIPTTLFLTTTIPFDNVIAGRRAVSSIYDATLLAPDSILTNKLYEQLDFVNQQTGIEMNLQLISILSENSCVASEARDAASDLKTISEYFSVSNDGISRKMLISDSYPGQKLNFLKKGLESFDRHMKRLSFCY